MRPVSLSPSTRTIIAILVIVALAIVFWVGFYSPKHNEASSLTEEVETQQAALTEAQSALAAGEAARQGFARNYQQLVVLGKAVPEGDESASLLVQLNGIARHAKVTFESLQVGSGSGSEGAAAPAEETAPAPESSTPEGGEEASSSSATGEPAASVEPTEAAAAQQPIGAKVGPAGLSVLPYDLSFAGSFFHVADFIHGIDSLIKTSSKEVAVDGRLITLDGFALGPQREGSFATLTANFAVTTYLVPSGQGITAGSSPAGPGEGESVPTSESTNLR
ncbi:MAG TPA: hypothetical protein VMT37_13510 [Solirubrobacterales bacterium]|nr:hypothetical protein [Solirubrobacterales bacterium]